MPEKEIAVVTGANGFVGSHLVDLLLEKGYHVRCITRSTSNLRWLKDKPVDIIDCGLYDLDGLRTAMYGASYLYHVAGVVKSKKPEGYFQGNVETAINLLDVASEYKETLKRVLIVSSQTASGPSRDGKPVDEQTSTIPITTYGESKLEEERKAKAYTSKLPITICRAPAVYGERDTEIFIFFKTVKSGLMTKIGFDEKKVSLIHVRDLVEGFYLAATSEKSINQTYFISSERFYTWDEIGEVTSKIMGKKPFSISVPHWAVFTIAAIAQFFSFFSRKAATLNIEKARDITQQLWICSTEKAVKELGYKQKIDIEEGIRRTVDWYKEMKWL